MTSHDDFLFCPLSRLSFSVWPLMTPFSFVHWVVCPSLYGLWWPLSLLSIGFSVLFMASDDPSLFVHWVVCPSLYDLWRLLSLLSIGLSVLLFMALINPFSLSIGLSVLLLFVVSDDPSLFCPLGCLSFFSLWPLMTTFSFVHWVVCPSLYGLWWPLSLLSIGLSVLLFMASDDHFLFCPLGFLSSLWPLMTPFSFVNWVVCPSSLYGLWWPLLYCPLGCLSFSLWPLMRPFSVIHWVVCPSSLYGLWWPLSLLSIGLSVLFMASADPFLFCPLGFLPFFSLWPLMNPFSFVHWVVCPSLYCLWWALSLLSIGLSVLLLFMTSHDDFLFSPLGCLSFFSLSPLMTLSLLSIGLSVLLFMASDNPFLFCPLGCLSFFSLLPLMTPFSFIHWVVCPSSLYGLWWPLSLCPLGCLSFSLWPLKTPFSFVHCVVCPSLYGLWWILSLLSIVLSVLLFMALINPFSLSIGLSVLLLCVVSDDPSLFCPLGFLSFSLWPLMSPFSFVHWVVCPSSLYDLSWRLSLLSIESSVLLCMASDDPFSFVHWVVCPSLYGLWWPLSLLSIGFSVLFMASDDPSLFVHWVVCPSLYDLWRLLSLLSIGLSVLLFMALINPFSLSIGLSVLLLFVVSDDPSLFCPLGCLSFFSLWPLMTTFSFVHWVVCPSLYGLWWPLSLLSIGLSVLLFMASDDHFLFCPLGFLSSLWPLMTPFSFVNWVVCPSSLYGLWWPLLYCPLGCLSFSLWPLMRPFSVIHWVVCPSSLYGLWWPLSLLSIGLSVLFMASADPFLFCPLGCLPFFSLWPLMNPFSFVHWVVCPSLYCLWWALSLLSIGLSVLLLFMTSHDDFLFSPLGCLSFFSLSPLMTLSLLSIGLSVLLFMASDNPFLFCPLGCLSFFSLLPLMTPFSFIHWVVCPSSLYGLWWPLSLCPLGCLSFSLWPLKTPFSFVHCVVCPSLYGLWWILSLLSIVLSVLLFMALINPFSLSIGLSVLLLCVVSDDPSLFCPLGFLSFSLWPLMSPFSFVHWVVCPSSLYDLSWRLSLLSIESSVLLFMASDDPFLFVHWVVCPSLYGLWWPLSLLSIGVSVLFMASDDPSLFVHWVVCPSLYDLWRLLSLLSIGLSVLLFMALNNPFSLSIGLSVLLLCVVSDDPSLFCPFGFSVLLFMASNEPFLFCSLGCLSFFSLWPLMTTFSFVHWVVCPSLYGLWWPLSLLSIGLSVLLFMASDDHFLFCPLGFLSSLWPLMTPLSLSIGLSVLLFMTSEDSFLFCPLGCLSFSLWPLMTNFSFVHWVFCPLYGLWWRLSLCPLGCLSFSLWPLKTPFSFVNWVVCPSSLYGLWWPLLYCPLGCLSSLWPLMTPFSFVHWVVCPSSLYGLWWILFLLSIGLSVLLLFMVFDEPFLFCPLGCLSFSLWPLIMTPFSFVHLGCLSFSLWPLMTPLSFVHWVVCPSLYDLWRLLSLLSIGLSVLLFMASDEPFLFCPLGCLSFFSLWPLMTTFSLVHWVVCPSSLYGLWWPFLFCPLGCLSFSLWPLITPFSFVHWVVCPSSHYYLWWPLSPLSIGLSVLLFMASDNPSLCCPLGCLSFFSLWPLMTPFSFVHLVFCCSLYGLWWPFSLLSIGFSVLFMASDDPFLFCPLGCLPFFSLWPLMTPFSFVHWVVCPSSLYGLWWPLSLLSIGLSALLLFMVSDESFFFCPLGCLSFFSLWRLMSPFSFVHWVVCPSSLYDLCW